MIATKPHWKYMILCTAKCTCTLFSLQFSAEMNNAVAVKH